MRSATLVCLESKYLISLCEKAIAGCVVFEEKRAREHIEEVMKRLNGRRTYFWQKKRQPLTFEEVLAEEKDGCNCGPFDWNEYQYRLRCCTDEKKLAHSLIASAEIDTSQVLVGLEDLNEMRNMARWAK